MKLKHITDVFFDLDHTLWDFDRNSALAFELIFKKNNFDINLEDFLTIYEPINLKYWQLYSKDEVDKATLRFGRLFETFKLMKQSVDDNTINKLSDDYIDHLTVHNHLLDDAKPILDYLNPNYRLHIITNGFKEVQQGKLKKSQIHHFFDTITNSEEVGVKKPDPKIFNHALEVAKVGSETSLMIGDNLEADIMGALQVGLDVIYFNPTELVAKKNIIQIKQLSELKNYL
ncbi:YjjG family noncanonical pyrimidine nucleotidase [Mangrovimonas aestuarii]|uniref:YjjG family noncanonical pyrimidine nucleotidase n=1 Tax=Mangrovimonas aestuarii TaxID=3018443 RepID=UPI002378F81C|nr:YjjG family noncanonical pyrimidine nucleotidase [Mangrovimonas aestuarii]